MQIQLCDYCNIKVLPSASGLCPSCNRVVCDADESPGVRPSEARTTDSAPHVTTPVELTKATSDGAPDVDDTFNRRDRHITSNERTKQNHGFLWLMFSYRGRVSRSGFWLMQIIQTLTVCCIYLVSTKILGYRNGFFGYTSVFDMPVAFFLAIAIWTNSSMCVKRLHDLGASGWWFLTGFIPGLGVILFVACAFFQGSRGENQYGLPSV